MPSMDHHVLVIEDDPGMRAIYRRVLEGVGFRVSEAADGVEAMALLQDTTPALIFLDMLLPHVNGLAVLNYINEHEHLHNTHVVIVSSNRNFERDALMMWRVEYIQKPIRPAQIRELAAAAAQP